MFGNVPFTVLITMPKITKESVLVVFMLYAVEVDGPNKVAEEDEEVVVVVVVEVVVVVVVVTDEYSLRSLAFR